VDVEVLKHGVATKEKWDELYRIVNENFDSVVFVHELDMLVGRRDKQDPAFSRLLYKTSRAGADDDLTGVHLRGRHLERHEDDGIRRQSRTGFVHPRRRPLRRL